MSPSERFFIKLASRSSCELMNFHMSSHDHKYSSAGLILDSGRKTMVYNGFVSKWLIRLLNHKNAVEPSNSVY